MAFVLAVLGGAAAVELSKLLSKDQKVSVKELEVLQSKEEELQEVLQEVQAELRKEKAAHEVDSRRVQELSNFAEQIQSVKTELEDVQVVKTALKEESTRLKSVKTAIEEESTKLKSDKQELIHRTDMLQRQQAELQVSTNSLRTENQTLAQQVESLMHLVKAKQEALVALSKHMEAQKAKAISAFKKFAQKEIDGDALLHEFTKLGLGSDVTPYELNALRDDGNMPGNRHVEELEEQLEADLHAKFSKQLRLISDSPDRLSMLLETVNGALREDPKPNSSPRGPALSFPTLKSPLKERQGSQMFSFLTGGRKTPRPDDNNQSKVPALNLSSVGYQSPAKSPHRALQPTAVNTGNGTALVFSTGNKENKKGSKLTVDLGAPSADRTTPRKPATPKRTRSSTAALMLFDRENQDPFDTPQELGLSLR